VFHGIQISKGTQIPNIHAAIKGPKAKVFKGAVEASQAM
jgi:hypothetical protein